MQPKDFHFGGGATETLLHPLVAVWLLIAIVLILTLPRKKAIAPFLLAVFATPLGQVVVLGGVHFTVFRILILTVLARMAVFRASASERRFAGGFNALDRVVALWTVSALVVSSLQWMETQALIKNLGDFLDAMGGYLVARFLIPDREAVRRTVKVLAAISVIQGVCMIGEQITHTNVFGLLGGVQLDTELRSGKYRAGGVLGPLMAGVFGGTLIPLFLWLWAEGKARMAAYMGIAGATTMVMTSNSSTSYLAYAASLVGLAFWPFRKQMRLVRWGLVATLVGLHLVMHGPVWSLIEKIDLTGGSSSYHRYMLVDNCIRHFNEWWLLGYRYYNDWGFCMFDLCNQFVAVAVTGGLVTLILFITIYSRSFGVIGNARKQVSGDRKQEWLLWCVGSTLFANVVASFGMNYVVQLLMLWFPLLTFVSVATFEARQATVPSVEAPDQEQFASAHGARAYVLAEGLTRQ